MNFRAGLLLATLVAVLSSSSAGAAPADAPASAMIRGACEVAFLATATLHDVSGSARCLPFEAVLPGGTAGRQILPTVEVEVPVSGMDTGNASRDGKMREMFRSDLKESGERVTFDLDFPVSLREFDLKAPSVLGIVRVGDAVSVRTTFTLTVSRSP